MAKKTKKPAASKPKLKGKPPKSAPAKKPKAMDPKVRAALLARLKMMRERMAAKRSKGAVKPAKQSKPAQLMTQKSKLAKSSRKKLKRSKISSLSSNQTRRYLGGDFF